MAQIEDYVAGARFPPRHAERRNSELAWLAAWVDITTPKIFPGSRLRSARFPQATAAEGK
jgi:hypothetical protein